MGTLKDRMQARMDSRPDAHTLAWWQDQLDQVVKGYRGVNHAVNLVLAEVEDRNALIKKLHDRTEALIQDVCDANAKIGELQAELTNLQNAMEKAREAYGELKEKISTKPRG